MFILVRRAGKEPERSMAVNRMRILILFVLLAGAAIFALRFGGPKGGERLGSGGASQSARLNQDGVSLLDAGDAEKAAPILREALRLDSANPVIRQNFSRALTVAGGRKGIDDSEKENILTEALAVWPENTWALEELSLLFYREKRYREAWEPASSLAHLEVGNPAAAAFKQRLGERIRETEGMVFEEGRGFTLVYSGRKRLEFEGELMAMLQREEDDLAVTLGIVSRRDLEVLLLTPDLGEKGNRPDPSVGAVFDGRIRLFLGEGRPDPGELSATVRHELVHALLFQVSPEMPAWLQEGLAQKIGERIPPEKIAEYRARLMQDMGEGWWVPPLSLKETFMGMPQKDRARAYAMSLLFVDFLERKYGHVLVPRLLAAMAEGKTMDVAALETSDASPAGWEKLFAEEMGR